MLKAFTLIELIVTLAISSIIIGLATSIFLNLQVYYNQYYKCSNSDDQVVRLVTLMQKDVEKAENITKEDNAIIMLNNENTIHYEFTNTSIIRYWMTFSDTFHIQVNNINTHALRENYSMIDDLNLEFKYIDTLFTLHLFKVYSRQQLFEIDLANNEN